jgi:NAD dependent epimerase/dehydratase family enzyme
MDEANGEIGGEERDVPGSWRFSIDVATSWEQSLFAANTPNIRKVALRSAMIMSPDRGGVFDQLLRLVRFGLGGAAGSQQFVSWIHDSDFLRSIDYLIAHEELDGAINLAAPNPVPNREFMQALRRAAGAAIGLPSTRLMLELGAWYLRTETELLLKSRRVIPGRLLRSGFNFQFPDWASAARDLILRYRARTSK